MRTGTGTVSSGSDGEPQNLDLDRKSLRTGTGTGSRQGGRGKKIVKLYVLGSWGLGVAVSASFFTFHHCILSFFFLRVCFVFTSRSLGSCFFLWSPYSVFVQGVFFVLSGLGSLFV